MTSSSSSARVARHRAPQGQTEEAAFARPLDGPSADFGHLSDRFEALRRQDETAYRIIDGGEFFSSSSSSSHSPPSTRQLPEYPEWREKIAEWSYHVVDHYDLDREIVAVAVSYLDRYVSALLSSQASRGGGVASPSSRLTKRSFQLVAVSCLYVACKLYGDSRKPMRVETLVELSRGYFTAEHVEAMERELLSALRYRVHPPTAQAFVRHLSLLLSEELMSPHARYRIEEVSQFVSELGVFEHGLMSARKSSLGLAAVLNVMDGEIYDPRARAAFLDRVYNIAGLDPESEEVIACRVELAEIYRRHCGAADAMEEEEQQQEQEQMPREESGTASPVSVAAFADPHRQQQHPTAAASGYYCASAHY